MKIGIDASRNRSGGAKAHIIGILNEIPRSVLNVITEIHIWSYKELLDLLPEKKWLIKHCPDVLNKSLVRQIAWQYIELKHDAKKYGIDVMLNTDAGTLCRFQPSVTMSRDMLSYEKGEIERFGYGFQRMRLIILKYIQSFSLSHSTGAIFLTKYASDVIQKHSGKLRNFRIIPHGVSDNFRIETIPTDLNPSGTINCIYISNIALYKHQDSVALAIDILNSRGYNVRITFIGGGEGPAYNKLNFIQQKTDPKGTFITQLPFLKHHEIPKYIQEADIFIFASSCENMPNTLIEGMSSGLPIACSNRGPMPEVLQDGGVYFDPENPEEIADAIENIIIDGNLRSSIKQRSLELSKKYSWERCSKETFEYLIDIKNLQ